MDTASTVVLSAFLCSAVRPVKIRVAVELQEMQAEKTTVPVL
jgi:hypothetical protein